jgi:hypothetical protein
MWRRRASRSWFQAEAGLYALDYGVRRCVRCRAHHLDLEVCVLHHQCQWSDPTLLHDFGLSLPSRDEGAYGAIVLCFVKRLLYSLKNLPLSSCPLLCVSHK